MNGLVQLYDIKPIILYWWITLKNVTTNPATTVLIIPRYAILPGLCGSLTGNPFDDFGPAENLDTFVAQWTLQKGIWLQTGAPSLFFRSHVVTVIAGADMYFFTGGFRALKGVSTHYEGFESNSRGLDFKCYVKSGPTVFPRESPMYIFVIQYESKPISFLFRWMWREKNSGTKLL